MKTSEIEIGRAYMLAPYPYANPNYARKVIVGQVGIQRSGSMKKKDGVAVQYVERDSGCVEHELVAAFEIKMTWEDALDEMGETVRRDERAWREQADRDNDCLTLNRRLQAHGILSDLKPNTVVITSDFAAGLARLLDQFDDLLTEDKMRRAAAAEGMELREYKALMLRQSSLQARLDA